MRKDLKYEALELSLKILRAYWLGDSTLFRRHFHPDIIWTGSCADEYSRGCDAAFARLDENQAAMPPVFMDQIQFEIVYADTHSVTVFGRYRAYTDPASGLVLSEKQRVTYVWEAIDNDLLIRHLHLSNALRMQGQDERFPTKAGMTYYTYLQALVEASSRQRVLSITDSKGVTHALGYMDILYIEADRNYYIIHDTGDSEIRVRGRFSSICGQMPDFFALSNRSTLINARLIRELKGTRCTLTDNTELPIAESRLRNLKETISAQG